MYKCKICGKEYQRKEYYEKHILTHQEEVKEKEEVKEEVKEEKKFIKQFGRFRCLKCRRYFITKHHFDKHKCK